MINRGNGKAEVFHKAQDYYRFTEMMRQSCERLPMRVVGWCLMPNHFHLVPWPLTDGDLSRWMQWLMTCHVRRYYRHCDSSGHIWQGRFKAFPIQQDEHNLTVLRYVERNPVRAGLIDRAEHWQWSSLYPAEAPRAVQMLSPGPVPRSPHWLAMVNRSESERDLATLRASIAAGPSGALHGPSRSPPVWAWRPQYARAAGHPCCQVGPPSQQNSKKSHVSAGRTKAISPTRLAQSPEK